MPDKPKKMEKRKFPLPLWERDTGRGGRQFIKNISNSHPGV
jgi:hypothetical protein